MELGEFDASGRRRPVAKGGDEFVLEADQLIAAIGQALDPSELFDGITLKLSDREYIAVDPITGQTSVDWIFAGGDAAGGPSSVIEAIAAGEKAAVGIDGLLTGETAARGARSPRGHVLRSRRGSRHDGPRGDEAAARREADGFRRGGVHLGVQHGPGRVAALPALRLARRCRHRRRKQPVRT